jgi:hypothetical protein
MRAVYGRHVVGGDATRLLEHAPKEVALSALPLALFIATGQRAWAAQVRLAMSLGSSRHPCHGHNRARDTKSAEGDGANLVMDGTTPSLGRLVPARIERGVELV